MRRKKKKKREGGCPQLTVTFAGEAFFGLGKGWSLPGAGVAGFLVFSYKKRTSRWWRSVTVALSFFPATGLI